MWEKRYLCDLGTVMEGDDIELKDRGFRCLDEERKKKLFKMRTKKTYWLSLGAGLLIQKAVKDFEATNVCETTNIYEFDGRMKSPTFQMLSMHELVTNLEQSPARQLSYTYGPQGKPYLCDIPMFFSLSHSGNLVYLVASDTEVGADLQQMTDMNMMQVANRFFADSEKELLNKAESAQVKKDIFFKLWTRKEAYGKYTGAGIVQAVGVSVEELEKDAYFFETEKYENYLMSICRKA